MDINPVFIAFGVAVSMAAISEAINWYLIYRKEDYRKLVDDINRQSRELDFLKNKVMMSTATSTPS